MATFIEFQDGEVPVRVALRSNEETVAPIGVMDDVFEKLDTSLTKSFKLIPYLASKFHESIQGTPVESAELELGLQFTCKGSLYVVDVEGEAAMKLTLSFKKR